MILTQCAACAAPLGFVMGKKCSRCSTRYCGPACQKKHWEEGGHDKPCKKIRKGGGAEQYHADEMYKGAVMVAAEACAEDTKGQTCYICTEAVHRHTKEGLVRGCACGDCAGVDSGITGIAHVTCLAEQAKILHKEAEENNADTKTKQARWHQWHTCSLCRQSYHGVVRCALSWACWKTYVSRPDTYKMRLVALDQLGHGLYHAKHFAAALSVYRSVLSTMRRNGAAEYAILAVQSNLAGTYSELGRHEDALQLKQDTYFGTLKARGEENSLTLFSAASYAATLVDLRRFKEARLLLLKTIPVGQRVFGESHEFTLKVRSTFATALYNDAGATLYDLREAVKILEATEPTARQVFGNAHPTSVHVGDSLRDARAALGAYETPSSASRAV